MWGIELRKQDGVSLSRQIYSAFVERILTGHMPEHEPLPSTRELARELSVSRNTVCEAYDMLLAEGYVLSRQGAPTRVAPGLRLPLPIPIPPSTLARSDSSEPSSPGVRSFAPPSVRCDFVTGQPDVSHFPWPLWSRLLAQAAEQLPVSRLGYGSVRGYEPLCEQIAQWLLRSRGLSVDPHDVFITAGSTQALHLLTELLCAPGRAFALENPAHHAVHAIAAAQKSPLCWMAVDDQGADVRSLAGKDISAAYVTPSHQFPLGSILTATRRAELIRLAAAQDFFIIEDDYDSEFRYVGAPVSPIYSMDQSRVAYVGTFSKTMFPALRLGFAVLPKTLHAEWKRARRYLDVQNPVLEQAALCEFLRTRKLDKHVQRMRQLYRLRRDTLLRAVEDAFGSSARAWGDASGLHVALAFDGAVFDEAFVRAGLERGVRFCPLSQNCVTPDPRENILLMGYGHLSPEQIAQGIAVLRDLITQKKSGITAKGDSRT